MKYWLYKFFYAIRGIGYGLRESSFRVHLPVAVAILAAGIWRNLDSVKMLILILCIGIVLAAELFNSSLESLGKSITDQHDVHVGRALDMAAGAVLVVSMTAALIGGIIFLGPI